MSVDRLQAMWFRTREREARGREPEPEAAQPSGCQEQTSRRDTRSCSL